MTEVFVGIDLAISKSKRLPVCVCSWVGQRLVPLELRHCNVKPAKGPGNAKIVADGATDEFSESVAAYLRRLTSEHGLEICRIAIDAPRAPAAGHQGCRRRSSEVALGERGISCFSTPDAETCRTMRSSGRDHLAAGKAVVRMPNCNRLWMLAGFALFEHLSQTWECIETYPQAIVHTLGAADVPKSKAAGVAKQLREAAKHTGWPVSKDEESMLRRVTCAPLHDSLDAYLCAWMASLPEAQREALGSSPEDSIWIPKIEQTTIPGRRSETTQ